MTVVRRSSFSSFLLLCFPLLLLATLCQTSDAASGAMIQAINCSTSGNYTPASAYAANLNQFLDALPEKAVSKNGGFFNGTVGNGTATVYGLAMCSTVYSRADCSDCLAATAGSNTGGLLTRCPGSTTVLAVFDKCLVHYSDINFLGTAETAIIYSSSAGAAPSLPLNYSGEVYKRLQLLAGEAAISPQRFAAGAANPPYALMQCTWDLPPDKCMKCLDGLSTNATTDWQFMKLEGARKSYSCTVRYSNTSFTVVPFQDASSGPLPPTSAPSTRAKKSQEPLVIRGAVLSVTVLVGFILVWFILSCLRWRQRRDSFSSGATSLKQFKPRDLVLCKDSTLGEGGFGTVYKGSYKDENGNQEVAVKKIKHTSGEFGDFIAELNTISATRHMNLVELKGWCCSRNTWDMLDYMCWCRQQRVKLFLVYEFVPNGSLHDHLHLKEAILTWEKRYQIVKGIGAALRYLHHDRREAILHRDIKPSNILLDDDFNAKLADFGLSRIASKDNTKVVTTAIGSEGYMDPQCRKHGKVVFGRKSDVYSLGIVLLEIACTDKSPEEVRELYRNSAAGPKVMEDAADSKLGGVFDRTQMERVIVLGRRCSDLDQERRPYMKDAMLFLEYGIELPDITKREGQEGASGTISSDEQPFLSSDEVRS